MPPSAKFNSQHNDVSLKFVRMGVRVDVEKERTCCKIIPFVAGKTHLNTNDIHSNTISNVLSRLSAVIFSTFAVFRCLSRLLGIYMDSMTLLMGSSDL